MNKSTSHLKFRKDIDGLRGLAVLVVVLYHYKIKYFLNGYLGVDIFFVISGFLITSIILSDLETNQFSISNFYIKRIKRIFPALFLTLVSVLVTGILILFPDELKKLALHICAGIGFFSNFMLYSEAGYFDVASEAKPLLHLWSLGVEEQFYLVMPILLIGLYRINRRLIIPVLFILTSASLYFYIETSQVNLALAFYSPLTRVWEILSGGLVACGSILHKPHKIEKPLPKIIKEFLFFALLVFLYFVIFEDLNVIKNRPYFINLLVVLPTLLIILLGENTNLSRILLQNSIMRFLGKISFPLYLLSWPLFVFNKILYPESINNLFLLKLFIVSIFISYLIFIWIETPIRNLSFSLNKKAAKWLILVIIILGLFSFSIFSKNGIMNDADKKYLATFTTLDFTNSEVCRRQYGPHKDSFCGLSNLKHKPTVLLIGDSHATHFFDSITYYYSRQEKTVLALGRGGCPPMWNTDRIIEGIGLINCSEIYNSVLNTLNSNSQIDTIIFAFAFDLYFSTVLINDNIIIPRENIIEKYKLGLIEFVKQFSFKSKNIILVKQIPRLMFNPKLCFKRNLAENKNYNPDCKSSREDVDKRFFLINQTIQEALNANKELKIFDPINIFCNKEFCDGKQGDNVLYYDKTHLNIFGSQKLKDNMKF